MPVALPVKVAADLAVHVGTVLRLRYLGTGAVVSLRVSGLFQPRDPAALYWRLDQISPSGVSVASGFTSYGPAVASPAAFSASGTGRPAALQPNVASAEVLPAASAIGSADLDGLAARLNQTIGQWLERRDLASQHVDAADPGQRRRGASGRQGTGADQRAAAAPARGRGAGPGWPAAGQPPG